MNLMQSIGVFSDRSNSRIERITRRTASSPEPTAPHADRASQERNDRNTHRNQEGRTEAEAETAEHAVAAAPADESAETDAPVETTVCTFAGTDAFQAPNASQSICRGAATTQRFSDRSTVSNPANVADSLADGNPTEIRSPPRSAFNTLRVGFNGRTCEHRA